MTPKHNPHTHTNGKFLYAAEKSDGEQYDQNSGKKTQTTAAAIKITARLKYE